MRRKLILVTMGFAVLTAAGWAAGSALAAKRVGATMVPQGTPPPPGGWANRAPTRVETVVNLDTAQLLEVSQGELRAWIRVPAVGARVGDHVLLGQGTLERDVDVPQLGDVLPEVVSISHVQVVDYDTAKGVSASMADRLTTSISGVYADSAALVDTQVVVGGTVVKAPRAIGWSWVHLQDGSGEPLAGTHDLTVKTSETVEVGAYVVFRGVLRTDVDLGFGYHYVALVEDGVRLDTKPSP